MQAKIVLLLICLDFRLATSYKIFCDRILRDKLCLLFFHTQGDEDLLQAYHLCNY